MNCSEIIQPPVALEILQTPGAKRLQKLFGCIYSLFQGSFIYWILHKYDNSTNKNKLWEDAKDAFQNGMMVLYGKSQEKGFNIKGNLKTTVYSFGLLQLLALFKKKTASILILRQPLSLSVNHFNKISGSQSYFTSSNSASVTFSELELAFCCCWRPFPSGPGCCPPWS